jgi:hypothetical protein
MRSGFRGVTWSKTHGKWLASVKVDGKHVYLGVYEDAADAGIAASDFRLQMAIPRKVIQRRANADRSRGVKRHKEKLDPVVARAIALKGHAVRKQSGCLHPDNKSGITGISWNSKRNRWFVQVRDKDGVKKRLGSYKDLDEAKRMAEAFYETGEDPRLTSAGMRQGWLPRTPANTSAAIARARATSLTATHA